MMAVHAKTSGDVARVTDHLKISAPTRAEKPVAPYPKRKLGLSFARSDERCAYDDIAWAAIAAANMRPGDVFSLYRQAVTVESVTEKSIRIKASGEKAKTIKVDGPKWSQFLRDLSSQLVVENHGANSILKPPCPRPLIDIFKRDPAVRVDERKSVYLCSTPAA